VSTTPPRRRPTPAVYRRRRLGVLLVLLLVVAGVVALFVWQPWRSDAAEPPPAAPAAHSGTPTDLPTGVDATPREDEPDGGDPDDSDAGDPDADSDADSDEQPDPAATSTAPPIPACTTGHVTVAAVTDRSSYSAGQLPQLSIALTNDSDEPCLINVGTAAQSFVVTSGSDTWWRSTDCQTESSDQVVQLAAGQTVTSATPLVWDRSRSGVDTCDRDRPNARAGYYILTVSIGGIQSVEEHQFRLR